MEGRRWKVVVMVMVMVVLQWREVQGQLLTENFYTSTCPAVESIVQQAVAAKFAQTFVTVPATLRLFFHDCFIEVFIFINQLKLNRN